MGIYCLNMKLFTLENYTLKISEEAYTIKAFRDLYKRDKQRNKEKAILELGFIYHFCDPRSDYNYIVDDEERKSLIKSQEGLPADWEPDAKVREAIEVYKTLTQTTTSLLLADTRVAVEKARLFLRDLDLSAVDDNGKPKYTIATFISAIKDIPKLVKELSEAEKAVLQEVEEAGRMRANRTKSITEDGFGGLFTK